MHATWVAVYLHLPTTQFGDSFLLIKSRGTIYYDNVIKRSGRAYFLILESLANSWIYCLGNSMDITLYAKSKLDGGKQVELSVSKLLQFLKD